MVGGGWFIGFVLGSRASYCMLCEISSVDLVAEGKRREHSLLLSWFPPSAKYREAEWTILCIIVSSYV